MQLQTVGLTLTGEPAVPELKELLHQQRPILAPSTLPTDLLETMNNHAD